MKKFVITLLGFIAILSIILLLKMKGFLPSVSSNIDPQENISSQYSSNDIKKLILKGDETLVNYKKNNLYYEVHSDVSITKCYYKKNKLKYDLYIIPSSQTGLTTETKVTTSILDFEQCKEYYFKYSSNLKNVSDIDPNYVNSALHEQLYYEIEPNSHSRTEFIYIRDEKLDGKDCIVIKVYSYDTTTNELKSQNYDYVYWIEKSTGFVIGSATNPLGENTATPDYITKNISYGVVKDSDFEIPTGF